MSLGRAGLCAGEKSCGLTGRSARLLGEYCILRDGERSPKNAASLAALDGEAALEYTVRTGEACVEYAVRMGDAAREYIGLPGD